ncbi:hypothetical protein CDD83_8981 [Cordyceps sp. RAO-2017]|nr:hypothetical protein CDD83_8981 [Cordyceps sp. RAO-2017]
MPRVVPRARPRDCPPRQHHRSTDLGRRTERERLQASLRERGASSSPMPSLPPLLPALCSVPILLPSPAHRLTPYPLSPFRATLQLTPYIPHHLSEQASPPILHPALLTPNLPLHPPNNKTSLGRRPTGIAQHRPSPSLESLAPTPPPGLRHAQGFTCSRVDGFVVALSVTYCVGRVLSPSVFILRVRATVYCTATCLGQPRPASPCLSPPYVSLSSQCTEPVPRSLLSTLNFQLSTVLRRHSPLAPLSPLSPPFSPHYLCRFEKKKIKRGYLRMPAVRFCPHDCMYALRTQGGKIKESVWCIFFAFGQLPTRVLAVGAVEPESCGQPASLPAREAVSVFGHCDATLPGRLQGWPLQSRCPWSFHAESNSTEADGSG